MSDIADSQSGAERLDDAELGADEAYFGDEPPIDYPAERPLGVEEPQVADDSIDDSVAQRAAREEPEVADARAVRMDDPAPVIAEDEDGDALTAQGVGRGAEEPAAEEAALHLEADDQSDRA